MQVELPVTSVTVYKADLPLKTPFKIALMEIRAAQSVFIRVQTAGKLYGMGEANPLRAIVGETQATVLAGARDLAGLLLGRNALDLEARLEEMSRYLAHNRTLHSAFDMALYDLLGKAARLPLYAVLGGGKRAFGTDITVGLGPPGAMARQAAAYQAQGFRALKIKLGTTMAEDLARVRAVRRAVGPNLPLRLDANQAWDCTTAVTILHTLESAGIEFCEQPVPRWDLGALQRIRGATAIPIMADESLFDHHDALQLAARSACDYFNIKLAKSGGLRTALKINAVAEAAELACMAGCMSETRLGLTAAAHLVSARPNIRYADLDGNFMLKDDPVIGGIRCRAGEIEVPDAPGHGADLDPAFLRRCESFTVK